MGKRDFDKALQKSEDSVTLNTSFIERLNLRSRPKMMMA